MRRILANVLDSRWLKLAKRLLIGPEDSDAPKGGRCMQFGAVWMVGALFIWPGLSRHGMSGVDVALFGVGLLVFVQGLAVRKGWWK